MRACDAYEACCAASCDRLAEGQGLGEVLALCFVPRLVGVVVAKCPKKEVLSCISERL